MEKEDAIIYVVDDEHSVRQSLSRLLRAANYNVETLASAQDFLQQKTTRGVCCLVLDLRMPGLNGLELQKALSQADRRIPIVFISGHSTVPSSVEAMKEGAGDFLQKPFEEKDLLQAVERALARGQILQKEKNQERNARWRVNRLTPREREVLQFVVAGRLNKQIAYRLNISEKTVKVHRGRVMEKMRAASVVDLVHLTEKAGLSPIR